MFEPEQESGDMTGNAVLVLAFAARGGVAVVEATVVAVEAECSSGGVDLHVKLP